MSPAEPAPVDLLAAPLDITEHPQFWYRLAEEDQRNNPDLVAEYLKMAALAERYIELRMGATP